MAEANDRLSSWAILPAAVRSALAIFIVFIVVGGSLGAFALLALGAAVCTFATALVPAC
jgi:hypothetical protein